MPALPGAAGARATKARSDLGRARPRVIGEERRHVAHGVFLMSIAVTGAMLAPAPHSACIRSRVRGGRLERAQVDHAGGDEVVAGQAVPAGVEAVAAAEREPADADGRAGAVHDLPARGVRAHRSARSA